MSTTSPKASSKVMSSDPSLFLNSRQREGSFSNRDVGIKVPPPCLLVQVPVTQNVSRSLFSGRNVE